MTSALLAALATALAVLAWPRPVARLQAPPEPTRAWRAPGLRRRVGLAAATGASALLLTPGLGWLGLLPAAGVAGLSFVVLGRLLSGDEERRRSALATALPQACDLLAVCLEAGMPLRRAAAVIGAALGGPLGDVLAGVSARVELGVDEATAWVEATASEPVLAGLGREVARSVGAGSALARTVRLLGVEARRDAASAQEARAKKVGVRSVLPLMLCFLPAFLLLGIVPIIGGVVGRLF